LPPGQYEVRVSALVNNVTGLEVLDVVCDQARTIIFKKDSPFKNSSRLDLHEHFELRDSCKDYEIRIFVSEETNLILEYIELQRILGSATSIHDPLTYAVNRLI